MVSRPGCKPPFLGMKRKTTCAPGEARCRQALKAERARALRDDTGPDGRDEVISLTPLQAAAMPGRPPRPVGN